MILSHRHRFLFIKTRKTAGTSLELALAKFCGPEDVITPLTPDDEKVRRELGYPGPQNFQLPKLSLTQFAKLLRETPIRWMANNWITRYAAGQPLGMQNHMSAGALKLVLPGEVWEGYHRFCFERNPLDKVISFYHWEFRDRADPPPLSEFILNGYGCAVSDFDLYARMGKPLVHHVARFENLQAELEALAERLKLPEPLVLPRTKSHQRRDRRTHQELLGPEERRRIEIAFAREIAMFGYQF